MSSHSGESTLRPEPDKVLQDIADYVHNFEIDPTGLAMKTASLCLIDTIGCGLEGLRFPECTKLLGPVVEGTIVPNGTCPAVAAAFSLITALQEPGYLVQTTSSIPSEEPSTSEPSYAGSISMTASWLPNVCVRFPSNTL